MWHMTSVPPGGYPRRAAASPVQVLWGHIPELNQEEAPNKPQMKDGP